MLKPYYYNRPRGISSLQVTPQDLELLRLMDEYRVLDSELLWALLKRRLNRNIPYDTLKRRLTKLWRAGFLERPPEQVVLAIRHGQRHLIYTLGREGLNFLKGRLTQPERERLKTLKRVRRRKGWSKEDPRRLSYLFLEHSLALARFRAALELAGLRVEPWLGDGEVRWKVRFTPQTEAQRRVLGLRPAGWGGAGAGPIELTLQPDAFFGLALGRRKAFHALELDRGSEKALRVGKKILGYYKLLKGLRASKASLAVEGEKVEHFRVLFVVPDRRRADRLKELVRAVDEKGHRGDRAFWFALQERVDWRRPETARARIWQTAPGEVFSLLD